MVPNPWSLPPNWLTLARILLTPLIGLALARADFRLAFPLLFAAGLTDAADGYLARRFGWQSPLGEKLDPIADKWMVAVVYLGLAAGGALPWWLVLLVLGRDLAILAAAGLLMATGRAHRFPPSVWGKASTIAQMTLGGLAVLNGFLAAQLPLAPLVWLTATLTLLSGADYARRALKY